MDHAAWLQSGMNGASEEAKKSYAYFMRPEPKDGLGPLVVEDDPVTGRKMRSRTARIGMVRNAEEGDKLDVKVYLDPLPHIRIAKAKDLQGWYQSKSDPDERHRPRPCFTDAVLTEPYGGYCTVGCAFCYVNSGFRGYRGSGLITVPLDYGVQVGRQLDKMRTSAAGYFSSFTDPFLPLEDYYHNTQRGAEAFVSRGLPIFFLSRLSYPEWAIDLLTRSKYSYAQKSINTPWEPDWQKLSPGAISLEEHLAEISKLRSRGIYVSIQCNPIIAGITTHEDVRHLFGKLAEAGANHVIVKFVEAGYSWAPTMIANMRARFGEERAAAFEKLFTCNIGHQKTVDEAYRLEGHRLYRAWATELGLTYATCYEYKFERSPEGEKLSARGVSIGRDFLTADQCHGHRVPMFSRESLNEPFKEVEVCPPSGCLTCADENTSAPGVSRCGSDLFGAAKALRLPDFKHSVWEKSPGLPLLGERPS